MKYALLLMVSIGLVTLLNSCGNAGYERNSDGLIYKIYHTGKGEKVKPNSFLKIHQIVKIGDSLFFDSFGKVPTYGFFDSVTSPKHDFLDILDRMSVGDSAIVIRSIDTLAKRRVIQLNETFKKGGTLKITLKVIGVFDSEQAMNNDYKEEMEKYKKAELAELEKYAEGTKAQNLSKTPEGVLVSIEREGKGPKVDSGMHVKVNYTGRLLNGTVFDSNVDSTFGHPNAFEFNVGGHEVIAGWDIGILKLNAGAKAKFFIPSMLGYGVQGSGQKIPPYSNLVFDIEVLEAKHGDSTLMK